MILFVAAAIPDKILINVVNKSNRGCGCPRIEKHEVGRQNIDVENNSPKIHKNKLKKKHQLLAKPFSLVF